MMTSQHYIDPKNKYKNKKVNNMLPRQQPFPQEVIQQETDITFYFHSIIHTQLQGNTQ